MELNTHRLPKLFIVGIKCLVDVAMVRMGLVHYVLSEYIYIYIIFILQPWVMNRPY